MWKKKKKQRNKEIDKIPTDLTGTAPSGVRPAFVPAPSPLPIPRAKVQIPLVQRQEGMSSYKAHKLRSLIRLKLARRIEAIKLYEPLPIQQRFHESQAKRRLCRAGNRGGKTLMAAIDVGMAITGSHPYIKFPKSGRIYIVCKDNRQIGETIYPKLFRAGAFKIIRDLKTGEWRSYRPWKKEDLEREHEAKPAPPIIPPRLAPARNFAWENKKENVPRKVVLTNGWEISFFTSGGKPPRGMDIDIVWFDEEISDPDWLPEMMARLMDRRGRFIWSATPQSGTDQFLMLSERAEEERNKVHPQVEEFAFSSVENVHFSDDDRNTLAADLTEEERSVRIDGNFAAFSFLMFPEFSMSVHGVDASSLPGSEIPRDWARYAIIDPGNQVCATLFCAIPPPAFGDYVYLFDEAYIRNADVRKWGEAMAQRCSTQNFEAFIIDDHGSRRSEMIGKTIRQQFSDELKRRGIRANRTRHSFIAGSDDIAGRNMAFRSWLRQRDDLPPKLRVLRGRLPNFEHEIKYYRRKRIKGVVQDEPEVRNNHLMDCCGYMAHCKSLKYVRPKPAPKRVPPAVAYLKRKRERRRKQEGSSGTYVNLGAGAA
jgi:hypothetical protein